jgi:acyl-CoA hydrolase
MDFFHPVKIGQWVRLRSSVNRAFRTSMEVGVKVWVEDLILGGQRHVSSAYLTFVAIDANGNAVQVPPIMPENEEEQRRYDAAGARREHRLSLRKR